jgi:hypothetical protein
MISSSNALPIPSPISLSLPNVALLSCRRWKKVSLQERFVPNILKSTVKFMNGLIFSLITLEEQPLKNKQSKSVLIQIYFFIVVNKGSQPFRFSSCYDIHAQISYV